MKAVIQDWDQHWPHIRPTEVAVTTAWARHHHHVVSHRISNIHQQPSTLLYKLHIGLLHPMMLDGKSNQRKWFIPLVMICITYHMTFVASEFYVISQPCWHIRPTLFRFSRAASPHHTLTIPLYGAVRCNNTNICRERPEVASYL